MAVPTVAMRLTKDECELMYKALGFWLEDLKNESDEEKKEIQELYTRSKKEHDKFGVCNDDSFTRCTECNGLFTHENDCVKVL